MIRFSVVFLPVFLCFTGAPAAASDDTISVQELSRIQAVLADLNCIFRTDSVERDGKGYFLNNVFCADEQYNIRLDANFGVVERWAE